jgi:hypothetical protein
LPLTVNVRFWAIMAKGEPYRAETIEAAAGAAA